jgi:antitoxin component YwqK of YwqJK toxin-antitoxin module
MAKNSNPKIKHHIKYYFGTGNIELEYYYLNDKLHRTDGPAIICYYKNGNIKSKYYFLNDEAINVTNDRNFIRWQKTQILI